MLALPAFAIAELAAPHDPALADLCRGITYASSASITLAYRRDAVGHPLVGSGFVVPRGEKETRLLAVSFVTSKWHGRAPDDVVVLRAFAGGMLDADLLERDDEDLVDLAHDGLAPLLGLRERPFLTRVYRLWRASPQYEPGHQAARRRDRAAARRSSRHLLHRQRLPRRRHSRQRRGRAAHCGRGSRGGSARRPLLRWATDVTAAFLSSPRTFMRPAGYLGW